MYIVISVLPIFYTSQTLVKNKAIFIDYLNEYSLPYSLDNKLRLKNDM